MCYYKVENFEGEVVFTGTLIKMQEDFEKYLASRLEYGLLLNVAEMGNSVVINLSDENILPLTKIASMLNSFMREPVISLEHGTLMKVLGIGSISRI